MNLKDTCSLEEKLWQTLDSILRSRNFNLLTKVHRVKAMVFPVVRYRCESWTIKKAKCQRTDTFELWWWRRLSKSPLDSKKITRKGNQPWIFTGRTDAEADTPILWPPDTKGQLIGKDLMLGKTEGKWRTGQQRMRWLNGIIDSMDISLSKFWEIVDSEVWRGADPWGCNPEVATVRRDLVTEQQYTRWVLNYPRLTMGSHQKDTGSNIKASHWPKRKTIIKNNDDGNGLKHFK